jgi:malate synthase
MVVSVEDLRRDMIGLLPTIDTPAAPANPRAFSRPEVRQHPAGAPSVARAIFLERIDFCVRHLAAMLGAGQPDADSAPMADFVRVQLWLWLHNNDAALDDGTTIDFALFDAAIQRVGERLPRRGLPGQENLLQAAWLLAELTHARVLPDAALVQALARKL